MRSVTRRELIQTGLAGAALLALGGCARSLGPRSPVFADDAYRYRVLSAGDRTLFAAIAGAMLAGALPRTQVEGTSALVQVVRGIDIALAGLPPGTRGEFRQLLGLLEFPITRDLAAGVWSGWDRVPLGDVAKFLERWRFSGIALFRTGYQALHTIVMAAWYGNTASWARIGYPGPPEIG